MNQSNITKAQIMAKTLEQNNGVIGLNLGKRDIEQFMEFGIFDSNQIECLPSVLQEMFNVIQETLVKIGADDKLSAPLLIALTEYFAGNQVYIPRGDSLRTLIRYFQINRDYTGDNINELARKHKVTFVTVYKAIRHMKQLEQRKLQA